jgi:hypothetical protein
MPRLKKPLQQRNKFKVPSSQWKKWPDIAQRVFNDTYSVMMGSPSLFKHPKDPIQKPASRTQASHWKTTSWNAAWIAADGVVKALADIVAKRGYART